MRSGGFIVGAAIGAGLMYLLDPDRGGRRRALARDRLMRGANELEDAIARHGRDLGHRARGMFEEARAQVLEREVDDRVLEERVRSEIGRALSNPSDVQVEAFEGRVTLSGTARSDELQNVVRRARGVRGVRHVDNLLTRERPEAEVGNDNGVWGTD